MKASKHSVNDKRSMKVVVCSHCVLNQNAKLEGIAGWPGVITEVTRLMEESNCGILQMPCPEMLYEGIGRFDKSVEQYRCSAFRNLSSRIGEEIVDQIESYLAWGYSVCAILAIDGSPSCGLNLTQSAPEWRGLVAGQEWRPVRYEKAPGVYMGRLRALLRERKISVPILGIPEVPQLGSLEQALMDLRKLLR